MVIANKQASKQAVVPVLERGVVAAMGKRVMPKRAIRTMVVAMLLMMMMTMMAVLAVLTVIVACSSRMRDYLFVHSAAVLATACCHTLTTAAILAPAWVCEA